jgi:hypothetical protein
VLWGRAGCENRPPTTPPSAPVTALYAAPPAVADWPLATCVISYCAVFAAEPSTLAPSHEVATNRAAAPAIAPTPPAMNAFFQLRQWTLPPFEISWPIRLPPNPATAPIAPVTRGTNSPVGSLSSIGSPLHTHKHLRRKLAITVCDIFDDLQLTLPLRRDVHRQQDIRLELNRMPRYRGQKPPRSLLHAIR